MYATDGEKRWSPPDAYICSMFLMRNELACRCYPRGGVAKWSRSRTQISCSFDFRQLLSGSSKNGDQAG
eukprot:4632300-Pleurochrysis_carterae.AAC.2